MTEAPLTMTAEEEARARTITNLLPPDDRLPTAPALLVLLSRAWTEIDATRIARETEHAHRMAAEAEIARLRREVSRLKSENRDMREELDG